MLVFRRWLTEGIAQLSYMVGDDATNSVAVIDPRPDVEIYVDAARELGVAITHVFETHIHADFMSGARELAARVGGARICVSGESDPDYGYEVHRLRDGNTFAFGSLLLRARFTPGHTPEHVCYELCHTDEPDTPWGVLTGDCLFVDSAGRPDLLGDEQTDALVEQLFETLTGYFLQLPDDVVIYPCHGKGSACGPAIGERLESTIGYERKHNRFLQFDDAASFKEAMIGDAPPAPTHYPRLKKINGSGPPVLGGMPTMPPLPPDAFRERFGRGGVQLIDARHMLAFGGGHIQGAINLGAKKDEMSVFAGWVLDPEMPILLVVEDEQDLHRATALLVRTGFVKFAGYLAGGMTAWNNAGLPIQTLPQMHAEQVHEHQDELAILDVRQEDEWREGHIPGASHHFVGAMREENPDIGNGKPVVTYCATGYRASCAASMLQAAGMKKVRSMPGSWKAWQANGLPSTEPQQAEATSGV